jgi:hypothetical protein
MDLSAGRFDFQAFPTLFRNNPVMVERCKTVKSSNDPDISAFYTSGLKETSVITFIGKK